jgi:predicted transcriptional regulator
MDRDEALISAFADELRSRRNELGFSQEELAYRAGVNRTYIAKLELSQNQPTLTAMQCVAQALEVRLDELTAAVLKRCSRKRR